MLLLDSSAIFEILKGSPIGLHIKNSMQGKRFFMSPFSLYEVLIGARNEEQAKQITQFFDSHEMIYFDKNSSKASIEIEKNLRREGTTINTVDIFIAGIAKANNLLLVTLDNDFKRVKGIDVKIFSA